MHDAHQIEQSSELRRCDHAQQSECNEASSAQVEAQPKHRYRRDKGGRPCEHRHAPTGHLRERERDGAARCVRSASGGYDEESTRSRRGRTSRSKLINTITRSAAGLQRLRCGSGGICRWHSEMLLSYGGEWMVIATMREIELAARGGIARHPPLEETQPPAALHTRPNSLLAHTPRANSASLRLSLSRTPRQRAPRRAIPRSTHTVVRHVRGGRERDRVRMRRQR